MLSENIKKYRKENNMSQDELAEKIGVSRQSISLWETDQTQPTIDNVIALSKIFNISSDMLLSEGTADNNSQQVQNPDKPKKKSHIVTIVVVLSILAIIVAAILIIPKSMSGNSDKAVSANGDISNSESLPTSQTPNPSTASDKQETNGSTSEAPEAPNSSSGENTSEVNSISEPESPPTSQTSNPSTTSDKQEPNGSTSKAPETPDSSKTTFDLFSYCRDFAINIGTVNGDYSIYQQDAKKYGGYDNEYFSISYWADSDMVEFCLHCPLSDTQSHNFYLRMRGGYNKKYEYASSKYYRDTGESFRFAMGYIDPSVFYDGYPISCDSYEGSTEGQTEFMEQSRVGICDLINCLKEFVEVENMECEFSDFDFVNF